MAQRSTFPRSSSLLPDTAIDQAEALLDSHRIEDAIRLADQQRKKVQGKLVVDPDEADELAYVYQRIGFQCLLETRFEDAGFCLFQGELDPRILISYFPALRGALLAAPAHAALPVFAGVAAHMPPYASLDDLIVANIVRNYSPFLAPNTRSAPPTAELRRVLGIAAHDMLEAFLRKWRRVRGEAAAPAVRAIVDTVLAKLFAQAEKTTDLYALLAEADGIDLGEVEPVFRTTGQYSALCKLYAARGDDAALLTAWSKLVDGEWTDTEIPDPLSDMFALLTTRRNRVLTQQWGAWLAGKDAERALKLLTAHGPGKRGAKSEDEATLLAQLRAASPEAAMRFLEHLVLQKRKADPTLHTELALAYIDEVLAHLQDEPTSKLWRAKAASYASAPPSAPFFSYFEATTPASPAKRARLRTALFLHRSSAYDAPAVRARLAPHAPLLAPELALVAAKAGDARAALALLARTVHDHASAAALCVAPTSGAHRMMAALAERAELAAWAPLPISIAGDEEDDAHEAERRLLLLLALYADPTNPDLPAATRLLAAHAPRLAPLLPAVLAALPPSWPARTLSSAPALLRAPRAAERALVKALAAAQNRAVSDAAYARVREAGAVVEEAVGGEEEDEDGVVDEKAAVRGAVDVPRKEGHGEGDVLGAGGASWASSGRSSVTSRSGSASTASDTSDGLR
ncbi:hypothetical protein BC834DRAFT_1026917 [Gloeopeniophorella convolvens]|nr:hypothetical protein BC834DRAFT_1026917 [Gloeopeniophorella convolvens]